MSVNPSNEFYNGNLCKIYYAEILHACVDCEANPFTMRNLNANDYRVIALCVNLGIDSHLEAIFNANEEIRSDGNCDLSPENLCVLLRRLSEYNFSTDDDYDSAHGLVDSILTVLGFDDCGRYVGRVAMGLE
jgi:hypothetical protein